MYLITGNYYIDLYIEFEYYKMKETLETKNMQLEIVSIHLNKTYQLLVQIAINNETEIIQLKKIKDMILNKGDKSLITLILIKIKDQNNWTLKRFYTVKPQAKEDKLLPSRYYWPDTDPEIKYVWPAEKKDILYGFGDAEKRVFMVTRSVLDKENEKIDNIPEGISQTLDSILQAKKFYKNYFVRNKVLSTANVNYFYPSILVPKNSCLLRIIE